MSGVMNRFVACFDQMLEWGSTQRNTLGLGFMRFGLGAFLAYIYAINYAQRDFLLGPARIVPTDTGLFGILPGEMGFQVAYHLAFLAAVVLATGYASRIATIVNFFFFWSYSTASTLTGDGGDNLLRLLLFYMMFANVSGKMPREATTLGARALAIVHNVAWIAIVVQLCVLYWDAGFQKAGGEMWRDGTALYYILQVDQFRNPVIANALLHHPTLLIVSDYATMIFQLAFPFMMFNRWTKYGTIAVSLSFHVGIFMSMCLVSFSGIRMSTELALLSNADYAWLGSALERLRDWFSSIAGSNRVLETATPE